MNLIAILFGLIHLSFAFLVVFLILSFFTGAPFVPTPRDHTKEAIDILKVKPKDIFIDLGSGDGRLLIFAAKRGAYVIGWEINPFLVLYSRWRLLVAGLSKQSNVYWGDYRKASLRKATCIFIYALPKFMVALEEKTRNELQSNCRIVVYKFAFPHWKKSKQTQSGLYYYTN